ncbi:MAG: tetratricopeptide repeat protein, partial [Candidatus Cloacimonetes bacterium]|nr:tetratricopeptide repeat protein [Candidatus Cloacimonadota bacterium]
MPESMMKQMHDYVTGRIALPRVIGILRDDTHSHLVEITGKSGSGKSYFVAPLLQSLEEVYSDRAFFSPHPLDFNHFTELIQIFCAISEADLFLLYQEFHASIDSANKFDFFYYITERLLEKELFKPLLLVIDDCDVLDRYSRDYLQYLVQYLPGMGIQIVVFSQERLFPFSDVEHIPALGVEDCQQLLQHTFPDTTFTYASESEIFQRITSGNLMIIEKIFREILHNNPKRIFDLSPYLEKTFEASEMYHKLLDSLTDTQRDLLISLYVLDGLLPDELQLALGKPKTFSADIAALGDLGLISCPKVRCIIQKKGAFTNWMLANPTKFSPALSKKLTDYLSKTSKFKQVLVRLQMFTKKYVAASFDDVVSDLILINDSESLLVLEEYMLAHTKNATNKLESLQRIAAAHSNLNQKEKAVDYYRQALHLCTENNLPAEQVVYQLANNLYAVNSSAFALEIIKKYSPATIDPYWKSKILLLKAEILTESEAFDDAFSALDVVLHSRSSIEDAVMRNRVQAEARKIRGKIHYYINEWEKAEETFKEAESLYTLAEDHSGLAAIYNNLGVLYMFQGDWEKSETHYLKSLALEKEHYNLNGISVCYNNLGGLVDDKGDFEKAIYYYEEALKIQKLLSEPYNITNIYNNIGVTLMDHGDFVRAEDALKKSLDIAIEFSFYRNNIASLNNLGALCFKKGDWTTSIAYYEQAIKKCQESSFYEGMLRSFNNLGEVYEKQNELNLAYDLYFKGLELLPSVNDDYIKAELYGNLGSVLTKLHKFKEAYPYLVESFDFFKNIAARDKIIEGCQKQAFYFIMTRNYESADYYISEAVKIATEQNLPFEVGRAYYLRALLERKNPEAAREHLNEAIKLFVGAGRNYELSLANYELAEVLLDLQDWEQALQILKTNKKIIQQYSSIKLLEQNDILLQR